MTSSGDGSQACIVGVSTAGDCCCTARPDFKPVESPDEKNIDNAVCLISFSPPAMASAPTVSDSSASVSAEDRAWRERWASIYRQMEKEQKASPVVEADAAKKKLEQAVADLSAQVALRDAKIRRMQDSFSWRSTAALRALRRVFFDRKPTAATRFGWEAPSAWDAAPAQGLLTGWVLPAARDHGRPIRLCVDGRPLGTLRQNLCRRDVVAAQGAPASAANCGFEADYSLEPERSYAVSLEQKTAWGRWRVLDRRTVRIAAALPPERNYAMWVALYSTVTPERAAQLRRRLDALTPERRPLISVVMPVYNTPEKWLVKAIESVRAQVYPNWELCIADDASAAPHVRGVLERFCQEDARIKVVYRTENGHISRSSNSALELATGEWLALLDHDDELAPDALAEVVLHHAQHPVAAVWYSDEDKIDEDGRRFDPYFKPDYLPDLLTGQNCLSHLSVYRTDLVRAVGGFRVGYEGSQDWDLALRVVERLSREQIGHIPRVLYHWRAIQGSTALANSEKDYTETAAEKALRDHFQRRGLAVTLQPVPGHHWRPIYPQPSPRPLVSIIIPTYNAAGFLRQCLGSVRRLTDYGPYEIIVVNNRSDEFDALALLHWVSQDPCIRVIDYDAPFNYSAINNFAVRHARGELVCLLNNDIEVISPGWLSEMVSHAVRPEIGAVGAMLYYPDDTIQHAGVFLGLGGVAAHAFLHLPRGSDGQKNRARLIQNYSAVTAACLLVRRSVFEEVGGFNERDLTIAFNDVDFCLKIRKAGYLNIGTPFAELYHHESVSRGQDDTPAKQARFNQEVAYMHAQWDDWLAHDPAYSPNLALDIEGMQLAWPPRV